MEKKQSQIKTFFFNFKINGWKIISFILLLGVFFLIKAGNLSVTFLNNRTGWFGTKLTGSGCFQNLSSRLSQRFSRLLVWLDPRSTDSISRIELIELSLRNMQVKKTRTVITIGGMMIGIGIIVFLVSVGYGVENLVITRIARLEEMKQADVSPQTGGRVKINEKTLADFKDLPEVDSTLPLIAVVGRVSYQKSQTDLAVYGVTTQYLKQSAIKPVSGKIFDSDDLNIKIVQKSGRGQVAGISRSRKSAVFGQAIQEVDFSINPEVWIRVREGPSTSSNIIGYTKRVEGQRTGEEVWGSTYLSDDQVGKAGEDENGNPLGKWIKAEVLLWEEVVCDAANQEDCQDGDYQELKNDNNHQVQKAGYFAEIEVKLRGVNIKPAGRVLGESTGSSNKQFLNKSDSETDIDWVEIASEAGVIKPPENRTVTLSKNTLRETVVNRAVLSVLGIKEDQAIGKKITASFTVVGDLLADTTTNLESDQTEYTIIGVTPEKKTPMLYVPFIDLRSLGITNFSQVKVVARNANELAKVRRQIEAMGYVTHSVADTVMQINSLFSSARIILMLLGMVALAVAALGMFNTLTVSLLERTREVGLMKALGMKSFEVQELFLTESMIMGFFGGVLGILLGWFLGKLLSIGLSFFALLKGLGLVDVSRVPPLFVLVIIFLSLLVGLLTGIFPARRATKISALNALRYE